MWHKNKQMTAVKKPPIIEPKVWLKSRAMCYIVETLDAKELFMSGNYRLNCSLVHCATKHHKVCDCNCSLKCEAKYDNN